MLDFTNGHITVVEIFHNGSVKKQIIWTDAPEVFIPVTKCRAALETQLGERGAELVGIKQIEMLEVDI